MSSPSFEIGRVFYNAERNDAIATCRLVDEKMISNMLAALSNKYVAAALTEDSKELIVSAINTHLAYKSKIMAMKHKDLKNNTFVANADIEMGRMFYHHENDHAKALSLLADEDLVANILTVLGSPDVVVMHSKEEFDTMVNAVAVHVAMKALHVRTKQEEILALNGRKDYSI